MEEKNYKEKLKDITTFIFDVDGVFTNTQVFVNNDGDLLRSMNMKDGFALKTAVAKGYTICIITGGGNVGVQKRFENQLVVHTSGNTSIEAIDSKNRRGVFYPLQTMNKQTLVDFNSVPFCLEAENTNDFYLLQCLALLLSTKTYALNSYQRRILHLAAVFMNNFSNHLVYISEQICKKNEVPFEILQPLLIETFAKLQNTSAYDAQTGPARRNDSLTIANHLAMLDNNNYKEIYEIITNSIINTYGRKEL